MNQQQFLKITFHLGTKKMNAYLKMPSPTFHVLKKEIEMCLFDEHKQDRCEIRTFWIDEDHDEIEIVNQCDYDVFMAKTAERQHLQVAPVGNDTDEPAVNKAKVTSSNSGAKQPKVPPAAGSYDFAVHDNVECDACLMAPIMGFRYKCIQCPNYDLCQNCESKHLHSEHMMVRMPTNNCPNVIEAYVTGHSSARRHSKRSKTACPFVKNGLSVVIDDNAEAGISAGGENSEQSSKERHHGRKHHRRQQRNNIFSHLYEMMHDLAEGGGASAAAHAMGEPSTASKSGQKTTNSNGESKNEETSTDAARTSARTSASATEHFTSQQVHELASKVHKIASEITEEFCDKAAAKSAKNNSEDDTPSSSSASTSTAANQGEKEPSKEKMDSTTATPATEPKRNSDFVTPSASLETLCQYLDPQYMKTGIQILNNFSDMFAKMLDPMENGEANENQMSTNSEKGSATATKSSSVSSNLDILGSEKKSGSEKLIKKSSADDDLPDDVEIDVVGIDSENEESLSESFVKLNVPKNNENQSAHSSSKPATPTSSAETTPPNSLYKSNVLDFAQLSADLKAHIAQEATGDSLKSDEGKSTDSAVNTSATAKESVDTTTSNTSTPKKPEEKRAVPIYHADERINNAVIAMMGMGFSNEGAWLTQLLESVNGNIPEALDVMSAAQLGGGR